MESNKKPYRGMASNVLWGWKQQLACTPVTFFLQGCQMLVNIFLAWGAVRLPALLVEQVTAQKTFAGAAADALWLVAAMVLAGILPEILRAVIEGNEHFLAWYVSDKLRRKLLGCFYQQVESKPVRELYDRSRRAMESWNGVRAMTDLPAQSWQLAEAVLCYILFGAMLANLSPWLILLLTATPLAGWASRRAYENWCHTHRDEWGRMDSRLDYLTHKPGEFALAKDIRIYGMAGWFAALYRNMAGKKEKAGRARSNREFLSHAADLAVILLRDGAAYALLIALLLAGNISLADFVLYFAAVGSFAGWVSRILQAHSALHRSSLAICDVREFLDLAGPADGTTALPADVPPSITFENVSFRYDGADADALQNISFTLQPGEKLAVVGANGAGKTTLVKLLCGLYLPTAGTIRYGGCPAQEVERESLYRLFAPVFQDVRTAFFTLAETVSCRAEADTDTARAEACMRRAGLGDKLDSLPLGIHTPLDKQVHKEGIELSGGEMQKLMLARALYKDAPVLVLDEPTAALDPIAENNIYLQYNAMTAGKSAVFISHRLASTRFCDRILVLEGGRIAEEGAHAQLIAAGGVYAKLYGLQSCWYQPDYVWKGGEEE